MSDGTVDAVTAELLRELRDALSAHDMGLVRDLAAPGTMRGELRWFLGRGLEKDALEDAEQLARDIYKAAAIGDEPGVRQAIERLGQFFGV